MPSKTPFLRVALDAAKKAEVAIMSYYTGQIEAELKADQTPVTVADKEAEEIIIQTIKESFADHGFLGEESGSAVSKSGYVWIIDPIDGTKNYIRKIPLFATQIALMKDDELILGVSNCPVLKELLYATKGEGAFMNGNPIRVSRVDRISDAMLCHGGLKWFTKKGRLEQLSRLIGDADRTRGFGDFYIFHTIASGRADIGIESAELSLWDYAALTLIIQEAGGVVTDMKGNAVGQHPTPIITANQTLHSEVLRYFVE